MAKTQKSINKPDENPDPLTAIIMGRPPLYANPEDLAEKATEYFKVQNGNYITITGLALFLGFASRQSFYDLEKREDFSYIIKKLRLLVENAYEIELYRDKPTGAIFALKNMGWEDRRQQEMSGNVDFGIPSITVNFTSDADEPEAND